MVSCKTPGTLKFSLSLSPHQLMEILDDPRNAELIAWLPHGRAFVIYRKREFAADVLPKYFQKFAKYSSFTRKLNRWGFVRVTRGPETGAYYHPLFRQNEGRLVLQMTCHSSISQNNNNAASSSKRANADSVGGSTAEASEPPSASMMMYPNNVNSSYGYASYNYLHPNAFAPMDHPSQQSYGPYGYDPPGGMLPPNAAGGPHAPYNHASSGMYPPHHQYPLMGAPAPYPMFPSSHNMMEGYGSYDEKQQQYSDSMLMARRNADPQQAQPYPNYHGGDDAHLMPPMDERGYFHGHKMKGVPSSFRPARKGQPQAPYYAPYAAGGVEGGPYSNMEDEEAERMRAASLSVDDSEAPRPNREEENALYSPAVRRPPAAYYGAHEGRRNEY
jgi:HSF-type DNA-binding